MQKSKKLLSLALILVMIMSLFIGLQKSSVAIDDFVFSEEKKTVEAEIDILPKIVTLLGDLDGDGYTTSADARLVLRISARLEEKETDEQRKIADLTDDGKLTAADARKILRVSALLETVENAAPARTYLNEERYDNVKLNAGIFDANEGTVTVTLLAENFAGTENGNLFLTYDPEILEFVSFVPNNEVAFTPASGNPENGKISFAFMFLDASKYDNIDLATIEFKVLKSKETSIGYTVGTWNGTPAPKEQSFEISPKTEIGLPTIWISRDEKIFYGDEFQIVLVGRNLKNALAGEITISYDEKYLEFLSIQDGTDSDYSVSFGEKCDTGLILWSFTRSISTNEDFDVAVLKFRTKEIGMTDISFKVISWEGGISPADVSYSFGIYDEFATTEPETELTTKKPVIPTEEGETKILFPEGNPEGNPEISFDIPKIINKGDTIDVVLKAYDVKGFRNAKVTVLYDEDCLTLLNIDHYMSSADGDWDSRPAKNTIFGLYHQVVYEKNIEFLSLKFKVIDDKDSEISADVSLNGGDVFVDLSTKTEIKPIKTTEGTNKETTTKEINTTVQNPVSDKLAVKGDTVKVDESKKLSTIKTKSSVEDVAKSITNGRFAIVDKDGNTLKNDALVGTGSKIEIMDNSGKVINTYTVFVPNDIDGNGKTTAADARLALRKSAKLENFDGVYALAADENADGKVTATDARKILRISAGLEKV